MVRACSARHHGRGHGGECVRQTQKSEFNVRAKTMRTARIAGFPVCAARVCVCVHSQAFSQPVFTRTGCVHFIFSLMIAVFFLHFPAVRPPLFTPSPHFTRVVCVCAFVVRGSCARPVLVYRSIVCALPGRHLFALVFKFALIRHDHRTHKCAKELFCSLRIVRSI